MLKITIDTSVVAEKGNTTLQYLVEAHESKLLDVAVASRFRMDKENDPDPERVERQKRIVARLNLVPSTFLIGVQYDDDEVGVLADDDLHQQLFCLFDIDTSTRGGRHTHFDVDHMYSHLIGRRDFFLTYESKMLKKRAVLKEVGINIVHPDKFTQGMKQMTVLHPICSSDFRENFLALLDQIHYSQINPQLLNRLQAMREAQTDIKEGRFTKEDEKAIRYIASNFGAYRHLPLNVATMLLKKQYLRMKTTYLSRYPNRPITAGNIVSGLRDTYGHAIDKEVPQ